MDIRTIEAGEIGAWRRTIGRVFAFDADADPLGDERMLALLDLSRAFACVDRGEIVATAAAFDFRMSLPGGGVPMSGLTMVTVMPTHRRRGILRGLIAHHLEAASAHGDPLSGLWASEATIYGRFGYGIATESETLTLNGVAIGAPERGLDEAVWVGSLEAGSGAGAEVAAIYDAVAAARPGMFSRGPGWWKYRRFSERPDQRAGASARAHVVFKRGEVTTGYVAFRQRLSFEHGVAAGSMEIDELVTLDAHAERSAWHFVTHIDLHPKVTWWNAPVDSAVPWLATDRRRVMRTRRDTMWLRVGDVGRVLAARRFASDGALRIGVEGETWALEVSGGVGVCVRVEAEAELALDRAGLGSMLLGGFSARALARAGRVAGTDEVLTRADRMFASGTPPWCPEVF